MAGLDLSIAVSTAPGNTALTRMLRTRPSIAADRVRLSKAAFAAAEGATNVDVWRAGIRATFTMAPPPAVGRGAGVVKNAAPSKLTSRMRRQSAPVTSAIGL